MIDRIIRFSIYNKAIIGLFVAALCGWGIYALSHLSVDALPDITNNQVQIITITPTLASQEVEQYVTAPIEVSCANLPEMKEIRSISRLGLSVITIVFDEDMNPYLARQLVNERIAEAKELIPKGVGTPELGPPSTGLGEIYQYVIRPAKDAEKKFTDMELRTIQDWIVRRQLISVPGVAEVNTLGGHLKQYEIALNPERLRAAGLSISDLFSALENNNENTGGSYIEKGDNAYFIRGLGMVSSIPDIENIVIRNTTGVPMLIKDVAKVQFGSAVRYGAATRNSEGEVVVGIVMMRKGENSAQVTQNIKERMIQIEKSLPKGVVIEPFLDRSDLVSRTVKTVRNNLIEGGLIVIFVLVLLLGNWRAGLVVASVIPLAMLFALGMMRIFGVSGNLMSLGAIDFGLIVDGAVIIVESIVHRVSHTQSSKGALSRDEMNETVLNASTHIRTSASFGELIILMVYLPILSLTGIEGKMFVPMAQVVSFAILGAFILSFTYVPMLSSLILDRKTRHRRNISDRIIDKLQKIYHPIIVYALQHKKSVLIIALLFFTGSLGLFMRMGGEFIPTLEEGDLALNTRVMAGTSLDKNIEVLTKLEKMLKEKFPEIKEVISKIGSSEIPTDPMPIEVADVMVILKDKHEWTSASNREELADKIKETVQSLPGISIEITQPIQLRFNELMTGSRSDVAVKLYGEDLNVLTEQAKAASRLIEDIPGVADLRTEQLTGLPQISVHYRRDRLAQYGINVSEVNTILRTAFAGAVSGVVFEGEKRFDMVLRLDKDFRNDIDNIRSLSVPLPTGGQIPMSQVADIDYNEGPMQISRDNTHRRVTIGLNVRNRDVKSLVTEIQKKLDTELSLPPGYYITYGGQFENMVEANKRLMIAVPIALLVILIMLYFTFHSFSQALLIFTAIPLSAIGGILALWLRNLPFSISAGVGFIALFGVAVLNGIVLIGYFNQLKKDGMDDIYQRVIEGTRQRLRPVIMTAAVASLGFLPMALSTSAGAEVQRPLATVVIGGLITATLLTLVVLPVLYILFSGERKKFNPAIFLITAFLALPLVNQAQTEQLVITPEQAIQRALEQNTGIKSAQYAVEIQKQLQKSALNIDKTNITLTQDPTSGGNMDNSISLTQNFAFPTFYARQKKQAEAGQRLSEAQLKLEQLKLATEVKSLYYILLYNRQKIKLLTYQDSLYSRFSEAASLRYQTGESNLLEKTAAGTELMLVKNNLALAKTEEQNSLRSLQLLLNTPAEIVIPALLQDKARFEPFSDSSSLASAPYMNLLKQQTENSISVLKTEKSKLMPDINLGYYSQVLIKKYNPYQIDRSYFGNGLQTGFHVGLSLPLWYRAQQGRIQAGKLEAQIAANNYRYGSARVQTQFENLYREYQTLQNTLQNIEASGLEQASLIADHAGKSFSSGNIGYVEYIQHLNRAITIRSQYLETLKQYNQTLIQLQSLQGIERLIQP